MKRPIVILSLGLLTVIAVVLLTTRPRPESKKLSQAEFVAMVQSNPLAKVRIYYPAKPGKVDGVPVMLNEVRATFNQSDPAFIARVRLTPELEGKLLARTNVTIIELNAFVQKARDWLVRSK